MLLKSFSTLTCITTQLRCRSRRAWMPKRMASQPLEVKIPNWWGDMSQPHFGLSVRMKLTLPKVGTWNPPGLPKTQSLIAGVKTPCIGVFLISLKRSWSVDVQNGLAWVIWTSAAQVMGKRRAGSQTGSLTPDHKKSGIDPIPTCSGGVRHGVGKLSKRSTRLV
jgi:hypothetical protein